MMKPNSDLATDMMRDSEWGEDQQMAFFWYRKAAEQGNAIAQLNVGYAYENGDGVDQDMKTALDWYRKSADHEDGFVGAYVLGECYERGKGVEKNLKEALHWYRKAASKSYDTADAKEAIRRLKSLDPSVL
jgi:TPR repeat protein